MASLRDRIDPMLPRLLEFRHDLHRHPEIAYEETRTADRIREELTGLGIAFRGGLAKGTGTVAFLPATQPGARTIALRADIDALPITEATENLPYASLTPGKMHACGHDGHTTILLGAAKALSGMAERPNNVLFLFQPAEEGGAGAEQMCLDGALEGAGIGTKADVIYGLHGWPGLPLGTLATRSGPFMASSDVFRMQVKGKGCHAAFPHTGIDPIVISAHIITALQTIVSRTTDPLQAAVVTIGMVHGGVASNIIPEAVELVGTVRTLSSSVRETALKRVQEIPKGIAQAMGGSAEVQFDGDSYPVTVNEPRATKAWRSVFPEAMEEEIAPVMGAEDFSFYGHHVPACFFALGLERPEAPGQFPNLHAPNFDFNDDALPIGIDAMCRLALS